jgi:hypothetical protein
MKAIFLGFIFLLATLCTAQQTDNVNAPSVKMKIDRLALEGAEGVDLRSMIGDIEASISRMNLAARMATSGMSFEVTSSGMVILRSTSVRRVAHW